MAGATSESLGNLQLHDLSTYQPETLGRCTACVLPRTLRGIEFDSQGRCGVCRAGPVASAQHKSDDRPPISLADWLADIRTRAAGCSHDCVVGLSGGRDSTYLLYKLAREHGLRCLVVYYRTPFTSDVIDANVRRAVQIVGAKLVEADISQAHHVRVARDCTLLWRRHPTSELINLSCAVCKLVHRELFRVARDHRVPTIVLGGTKHEEVQFLPAYTASDETAAAHSFLAQGRKMLRVFQRGMSLLMKCPRVLRHVPVGAKAALLYITPHTNYLQLRYRDVQCVDYFFLMDYDEARCMDTIRRELGWERPPDCITDWRADCSFAELKNFMFLKTMGASYTDAYVANVVRSGEITRAQALERLAHDAQIAWGRIRHAAEVLELPADFFDGGEYARVTQASP